MEWPGNSPHCNPIETLWAIVKRRIRTKTLTTKNELICELIQVWLNDCSIIQTCKRLITSMPDRIMAVIKAKDGHTKY